MNSSTALRRQILLADLAAIEREQDDPTLSIIDQRRLDDEWEILMDELESLNKPALEVIEEDESPVPICNCDADGECSYCEEARWNAVVDTREGCARCSGCAYCSEGGDYDGTDEV
jgi:hypothetical protein